MTPDHQGTPHQATPTRTAATSQDLVAVAVGEAEGGGPAASACPATYFGRITDFSWRG